MYIKQLTISLQNDVQSIGQVTDLLAQNCINIRALSSTEKGDRTLLHFIVNDTEKARKLFDADGYEMTTADVVVIEVPDKPGGLASVMRSLKSLNLQVVFLSAFSQKSGEAGLIIMRFNDPGLAVNALQKSGLSLLSHEELFAR